MNILPFFAHPDDETMMVGGTLALLAATGAHVHFVSATRGEGGENGDPPLCTLEELGAVREAELRCAVDALGGETLEFLDYIDPRVGPDDQLFAYTDDLERVAQQAREAIERWKIDVVFTHGSNGEYGHPAHLLTHRAVCRAFEQLGEHIPLLYTAHANFAEHPRPRLMNKDDPADLIVDIGPAMERKRMAVLCHRTQHALFTRRPSAEAGRPLAVTEVILPVESLHRHLPPVENRGERLEDQLAEALYRLGVVQGV